MERFWILGACGLLLFSSGCIEPPCRGLSVRALVVDPYPFDASSVRGALERSQVLVELTPAGSFRIRFGEGWNSTARFHEGMVGPTPLGTTAIEVRRSERVEEKDLDLALRESAEVLVLLRGRLVGEGIPLNETLPVQTSYSSRCVE